MTTLAPACRPTAPYRSSPARHTLRSVTSQRGAHRYSLTIPDTTPETAGDARDFVRKHAPEAVEYAAVLAVSELVGNVVRHAPGPARVCLTVTAAVLVLTVTDQHPETEVHRPDPAAAFDLDGEAGRGLAIVAALATLSIRHDDRRKRVTARLTIGDAS